MNLAAPLFDNDGRLYVDYSFDHFCVLNNLETKRTAARLALWRVWMQQTSAAVQQALMDDYHEEGGGKNDVDLRWLEDE